MEFIEENLLTYRSIKEQWDAIHETKIRQEAIEIAILRSALGYRWKKGCETGPKKYLCKADAEKLSTLKYSSKKSSS